MKTSKLHAELIRDVISSDRDDDDCVCALLALADLAEEAGDEARAVVYRTLADDPEVPMGYLLGTEQDKPAQFLVEGTKTMEWRQDVKRCTGVNLEDTLYERFYAIWLEDCYDPPVAIVRASGDCDALDWFCDELPWSHISLDDLADYEEDAIHYSDSGTPCDIEALGMREVWVLDVTL